MPSCTLAIRLTPHSKRPGIVSVAFGCVEIAVSAPPVHGKANEAMIWLLAHALGMSPSAIALTCGITSQNAIVAAAGMAEPRAIGILGHPTVRS